MAYALTTYTGDGGTVEYNVGFNWLAEDHVLVTVNAVTQVLDTDYTITASTNKVTFTTAPAGSAAIVIKRVTPKTEGGRVVNFTDGSGLSANDLNDSILQHLYIIQEMIDADTDVAAVGLELVDDATPQLGGDLDSNTFDIQFDDGKGIRDDSDNETLLFGKTTSAVNYIEVSNSATGSSPVIEAKGDDTNVGLVLTPKGTGDIKLGTLVLDGDNTVGAGQDNFILKYDHSAGKIGLEAETSASILGSFKNKVVNGSVDVWQRGTSFTTMAHQTYMADNYAYYKNGTMVHSGLQSSDVPTVAESSHLSNYSLHIDCTTADASLGAGDYSYVSTFIEGYNFKALAQQAFTLSFWVKATKTGTYCVSFRNSGADRSYVAEYTVSVANTWEKKTITVSASPSAGTWNYTNGKGLEVIFTLGSGSTFHTTAGSWQTGNFIATASQVNSTDSASNDFRLAQVQIELGSSATSFEGRDIFSELALCGRYHQRLGSGIAFAASATTTIAGGALFPVEMKSTPTLTLIDTTIDIVEYGVATKTSSGSSIIASYGVDTRGFGVEIGGFSGMTVGRPVSINQSVILTADAVF